MSHPSPSVSPTGWARKSEGGDPPELRKGPSAAQSLGLAEQACAWQGGFVHEKRLDGLRLPPLAGPLWVRVGRRRGGRRRCSVARTFFFILGLPQYGESLLILIERIPITILFAWIYNGTGRSLLLMILFHASLNTWSEALSLPPGSTEPTALSLTVITWVAAVIVILMNVRARRAGGC